MARGGTPAVENRHAAHGGPGAVDDERHRRLLGAAETNMLNRRHEAPAPHMLVVGKPHRSIDRDAGKAFRLQQLGDLSHGKFAQEALDSLIELIRMGAAIEVIEPLRRVEHRVMTFQIVRNNFQCCRVT